MSEPDTSTRFDKWLWAVRVYKTRNLATVACRNGQVRISGQKIKPSRTPAPGDVLEVKKDQITLLLRVVELLDTRVASKLVPQYMEDITPAEELERARKIREELRLNRVVKHGEGRPTKRRRRDMEGFLEQVRQSHDLDQNAD